MVATANGSLSLSSGWIDGISSLADSRLTRLRQQFIFCFAATFIDGVGTFLHLTRGATEANPIWISVIDQIGAIPAMGIRVIVGVILLTVLFAAWRGPLARLGLTIMVLSFSPLTLYHLFLLLYLPTVS